MPALDKLLLRRLLKQQTLVCVCFRLQVVTTSFSFLAGVAWDQITKAPDSDVGLKESNFVVIAPIKCALLQPCSSSR